MGPDKGGKRAVHPVMVLLGCVLLLGLTAQAIRQTKPPAPKTSKSQKVQKAARQKAAAKARADSLVAAQRADSLRAVAHRASADSLRQAPDSLAAQKLADSLATTRFRKVKNDAFGVGERLVFDVNYGFVTAGEAVMEIPALDTLAGRKCYRVEFRVNSLPSFSWIYRVEDRYLTFIDVEAIAPLKFEQHIREGDYKRDFVADFDQVGHVARTTEGEYPVPPYVHDIMSAFYFARTVDFSGMKTGDQVVLQNFYKDKSYDLAVKLLGRQELEVAAGTFHTVVVEPLVKEGGLFKSEGRIVIWLTDDERKLPVRVNTKVIIGSIDTELRDYSGTAGPVRAKIK
jgi:hypothetical protein